MLLYIFYWKPQYLHNIRKNNFFCSCASTHKTRRKMSKCLWSCELTFGLGSVQLKRSLIALQRERSVFLQNWYVHHCFPTLNLHLSVRNSMKVELFWILFFACQAERENCIYYTETSRSHSRQLMIKSIVPTR